MISVIVPVYNVEAYIRQCIDSLISQTFRDLEILLVDDGSTDGCGGICDKYAADDSRVRVIHKLNGGISSARNAGLDAATGEYIGFVDSDDWIEPRMFEVLHDNIVSAAADISVCAFWHEYTSKTMPDCGIGESVLRGDKMSQIRLSRGFGNTVWNKLFRRRCWEKIRFPLSRNYEDVATVYKIFMQSGTIVGSSERLYHYRRRAGSITTTPSMKNLNDHWLAHLEKFECINAFVLGSGEEMNGENWLRREAAVAAVRPFRWLYGIPKKERDYGIPEAASKFLRENFRAFGEKGWEIHLIISAFLARRARSLNYVAIYYLNRLFKISERMVGKKELYP